METIPGYAYVVTASEAVTVTDSHGLVLEVPAGEQRAFVATTEEVTPSGDCTIVQVRGNFSLPPAGGGGGGQITVDPAPTQGSTNAVSSGGVYTALREPPAPTPEPLGTTTTLKHGHVYTLAVGEDTDLSALSVAQYATCELWLDYTAGSVTWPALYWLDGTSSDAQHDHDVPPDMSAEGRYRVTLRNEGSGVTYANVAYSSAIPTTPAQS